MNLAEQRCVPCEGGVEPLSQAEAKPLAEQVPAWTLGLTSIERKFKFKDFRAAMAFVNQVADIAEDEGHHPDIHISYSKVLLELSTHAIGGLSENDFILAAKIDRVVE